MDKVFKIKDKVASVKNAAKVGVVVETGLPNAQDVQWIKVKFGKSRGRWILADAVREYQASMSIPVPDKVVVLVRPGHAPEVFEQPGSTATHEDLEAFFDAISRMFLVKGSFPQAVAA